MKRQRIEMSKEQRKARIENFSLDEISDTYATELMNIEVHVNDNPSEVFIGLGVHCRLQYTCTYDR